MTNNTSTGRVYAGEGMQERVNKRKQQFINASLVLFGTVGYQKTTLKMLCSEAKLTDRYFYESFENMEQLLADSFLHHWDIIKQDIIKVLLSEGDAKENTIKALDSLFSALKDPKLTRLCLLEILGVSDRVDKIYNTHSSDFAQLLLAHINNISTNRVSQLSPEQETILTMSLIGAISQIATTWMLEDYQWSKQDVVNASILIIQGLALPFGLSELS